MNRIARMAILSLVLGLALGWLVRSLWPEARRAEALPTAPTARIMKDSAADLRPREERFLRQMEELRGFNGSSLYNLGVYRRFRGIADQYLQQGGDARVLEIGPGINLGTGLLFALGGAEKYYGLDVYQDPDLLSAPQYQSLVALFEAVCPGDIRRNPASVFTIRNDRVRFHSERIEYLYPRESYDIPLGDGSVDFVFSNATLEHVRDPGETIRSIHRVLVPGGVTAHIVDLRDHENFGKPLEFLKVPSPEWEPRFSTPETHHLYLNRWRAGDFREAFEDCGFEILLFEATSRWPVDEALRGALQPEFRSRPLEDLGVTGIFVVARRP